MTALSLPGLTGARVLVTGGSRGIGRATVRLLAEAGASVGVAFRDDSAAAESIVAEARDIHPGGSYWSQAADLSRETDARGLFERCDAEFGGLDGFVGNAGIWNETPRPIETLELAEWRRMIEVNLTSIYVTTRAAAARLRDGGRIVLVSSTAAQRGEAEHSHYAASKGAVISFTKSIATELGPRGITANAVAPGWVDTEMSRAVLATPAREGIERDIPLRRIAAAEDVAGPIIFLLSDLARHITGEVLNVNGGSVLCG
ncbi:MAG: SDR family NAD(P)-dependent oxidoreductase [Gemmatimonadota bacterium]|nr:SDR family NAD(P)-dependent oxidoreductase [Gemmatimonadota bacterium]